MFFGVTEEADCLACQQTSAFQARLAETELLISQAWLNLANV